MLEGHPVEDGVVSGETVALSQTLGHGEKVGVAEHDRLWQSCGAGGEEQEGDVVWRGLVLSGRLCLLGVEVGDGEPRLFEAEAFACHRVRSLQPFGDEDGGDVDALADLGHALQVAVIGRAALGCGEGAGDEAATEAGPEGGEEVDGVSCEEEDPVAGLETAVLKRGEGGEGTPAQLGIGQALLASALADLDQLSVALRGAGELPGEGSGEAVWKGQ